MHKKWRALIVTGVLIAALLTPLLFNSFDKNTVNEKEINRLDYTTNEEKQNMDKLGNKTELTHQDDLNQDGNEILIDPRLPEASTKMILKHFSSMDSGDIELFKSTLASEDGGDSNTEPNSMQTFEKYNATGVYIKEIWLYNDALPISHVLDEEDFSQLIKVVIRNPNEDEDESYWLVVTNVKDWGISRYVHESQLK